MGEQFHAGDMPRHDNAAIDQEPKGPTTTESSDVQLAPMATEQEEEIPEKKSQWRVLSTTLAVCLVIFCLSLDTTILNTAIPRITEQFHSLEHVGWYGSSYLLTTCATSLMYGKLYTFFPDKLVFLAGLLIFEIGSLVAGATPTSIGLIIGRVVAGMGAGGLLSGSIILLSRVVAVRKLPAYIGTIFGVFAISSVAGPLLGGVLTDHATWRWCFYINLPLGFVSGIAIMFAVPRNKPVTTLSARDRIMALDLPGTALFLPAIILIVLALEWGGTELPWSNVRIVVLLVVAGVLLVGFTAIQWWRGDNATLPGRLMRNRNVWGSALYTFFITPALMVTTYYLPTWFQAMQDTSATKSGILTLPCIVAVALSSALVGLLVTLVGYYTPFMVIAAVLQAIGQGLLSTLSPTTSMARIIAYQIIFGLGAGLGLQQGWTVIQTTVPREDVPQATAVVTFVQTLSGALFIPVGQNIFMTKLVAGLHGIRELSPAGIDEISRVGALSLRGVVDGDLLPPVLAVYSRALTCTFYIGIVTGGLALVGAFSVERRSVKGRAPVVAVG